MPPGPTPMTNEQPESASPQNSELTRRSNYVGALDEIGQSAHRVRECGKHDPALSQSEQRTLDAKLGAVVREVNEMAAGIREETAARQVRPQ